MRKSRSCPNGCVRGNRSRPKACAREFCCVNERVFRLSAPLHKALPRPVEPIRALVSGEAEDCWRSTMAVQTLRKREVVGSTPTASTNFEGANRASPARNNFEGANRASPARAARIAQVVEPPACTWRDARSIRCCGLQFAPLDHEQVTALVRRRGKFETCGEHHFCVGSPTGRRRFPQKEDSAGSNPSRRTNAHVDQRQESPPSKRGQCWFESNHGHQKIRGRGGIGIRAGLKPRSLQVRSLSPAPFHARLAQRQSGAPTKLRSGFRNSQRAP